MKTEAAFSILSQSKFDILLKKAIVKAAKRAKELRAV